MAISVSGQKIERGYVIFIAFILSRKMARYKFFLTGSAGGLAHGPTRVTSKYVPSTISAMGNKYWAPMNERNTISKNAPKMMKSTKPVFNTRKPSARRCSSP